MNTCARCGEETHYCRTCMTDMHAENERLRAALDVDGIADLIAECHLRPEGVSPRQIAEEIVAHIRLVFDDQDCNAI